MPFDIVDPRLVDNKTDDLRKLAYRELREHFDAGKISFPDRCEQCGRQQVHIHHEDYSKPLDVKCVCGKCHELYHHGRIRLAFRPHPLKSKKVEELKKFAFRYANWKTVAREFGMSVDEVAWYLSPERRKDRVAGRLEMLRAQWILEVRARMRVLRIAEYLMLGHTYEETIEEFGLTDRRDVAKISYKLFRIPMEFRAFHSDSQKSQNERAEKTWRRNSNRGLQAHKEMNWDWDVIRELEEAERFSRFRDKLDQHIQLNGIEKLKALYHRAAGVDTIEGIGLMGEADDTEES